jgi:transcriptional regulator with PAS, ATPase and Fis domain
VKGAFTGAVYAKKGLFELADKGTLFFDEIGNIPLETQAKLLRVMQEREFMRLGGVDIIKVDVRVVAATNVDLRRSVDEGRFREDLFYRLNVITIALPPLRERRTDIPLLVEHFLKKYAQVRTVEIPERTLEILMAYDWPGNVRELESVIERALVLGEGAHIEPDDLPAGIRTRVRAAAAGLDIDIPEAGIDLDGVERALILKALSKADGNVSRAARLLGVSRRTLQYRLDKIETETPTPKGPAGA